MTLYLVATPIGNLKDITIRAIETLQQVDLIASEDTRKTGRLLKAHNIATPQMAFHEHNKAQAGERIIQRLQAGDSVAVVTDAGSPGISDPGFSLVRRAYEHNIPVTMLPGPAALIPAVVLSGLAVHSFTFRGFPPRKPGKRRTFLAVDEKSPHTLVYYESPHRLEKLLADCLEVFGDRPAAIANELTKMYERIWRGSLSELLNKVTQTDLKGEFVVIIAGQE